MDDTPERPTREELTEALAAAVEEIDELKPRVAQLERVLGFSKVLLNLPRKRRRVVRKRDAETQPPARSAAMEK